MERDGSGSVRALDPGEARLLHVIMEGTAAETGDAFFKALVENLAGALEVQGAWVSEFLPVERRLRAHAFILDGQWVPDYEYGLAGTPCETAIESRGMIHIPERVVDLYPGDPDLAAQGAVSYLGAPLPGADGEILGHLAVMDRRPLASLPPVQAVFRIFAARAAAEMRRLRAEAEARVREGKLARVMNSAMDGIIELDAALCVTFANPAAERLFRRGAGALAGAPIAGLLTPESADAFRRAAAGLSLRPERQRWTCMTEAVEGQGASGSTFPMEAAISMSPSGGVDRYTVVLRDLREKREAQRRINVLSEEKERLAEALRVREASGEILGESAAAQGVLRQIAEVAPSKAAVLILGETGTGKELAARAIHRASPRSSGPLIAVNCAAMPPALAESELFGHERGAFTGAAARRIGRFALADGGTIFLDEVGEMPLESQAKLLRVLQEGSFEPLGGAESRRVDVRVIAATNRDLREEVRAGRFREDLYYRLGVFPLHLPPLRERAEDIPLLAAHFAQVCAAEMGRTLEPLASGDAARLAAYPWPGNIRELRNVMERAVITAKNGRLNLERALPPMDAAAIAPPPILDLLDPAGPVRTEAEFRAWERANLLRALSATGWRVAGKNGAAELLGVRPSTLASRIKALGLTRAPGRPA